MPKPSEPSRPRPNDRTTNSRTQRLRLSAENEVLRARVERLHAAHAQTEAQLAERTEQVETLSRSLVEAEEREQERLAEVLHDHLQQILHGAKLWADLLNPAMAEDVNGPNPVERLRSLLQDAMSTTRSLATVLHPPDLDDGLVPALGWLARHMETLHGLPIVLNTEDNPGVEQRLDAIDGTMREVLFEAVRELLFNVAKHAEADYARISVTCDSDTCTAVVEDHGQGFDTDAPRASSQAGGLGLRSVRERLARHDGSLQIESTPGIGTRAVVTVPLSG